MLWVLLSWLKPNLLLSKSNRFCIKFKDSYWKPIINIEDLALTPKFSSMLIDICSISKLSIQYHC